MSLSEQVHEHLGVAIPLAFLALLLYLIISSRRAGLDHIPGPFLARYTDAWSAFRAWKFLREENLGKILRSVDGYGEVVRVGPRKVLVLSADDVHATHGLKARLNKVCVSIIVPSLLTTFQLDQSPTASFPGTDTVLPLTGACLSAFQTARVSREPSHHGR